MAALASGHIGPTGVSVEINVTYLDAAYADRSAGCWRVNRMACVPAALRRLQHSLRCHDETNSMLLHCPIMSSTDQAIMAMGYGPRIQLVPSLVLQQGRIQQFGAAEF